MSAVAPNCASTGRGIENFCQTPSVKQNLIDIFQNFTRAFNGSYTLLPIEPSKFTPKTQGTDTQTTHSVRFGIKHAHDFLTAALHPSNFTRATYHDKIICTAKLTEDSASQPPQFSDWQIDCRNGHCIYPASTPVDLTDLSTYNTIAAPLDLNKGAFPASLSNILSNRASGGGSSPSKHCLSIGNAEEIGKKEGAELIAAYLKEVGQAMSSKWKSGCPSSSAEETFDTLCLEPSSMKGLTEQLTAFFDQHDAPYSFKKIVVHPNGASFGTVFENSARLKQTPKRLIQYQDAIDVSIIKNAQGIDLKVISGNPFAKPIDPSNGSPFIINREDVFFDRTIHVTPNGQSSTSAPSSPSDGPDYLKVGIGIAMGAFATYKAYKKVRQILDEKEQKKTKALESAPPKTEVATPKTPIFQPATQTERPKGLFQKYFFKKS
jgi:hypothetical protein